MNINYCANCGAKINEGDVFCGNCGEKISPVQIEKNSCPGCGYVGASDEKYCPECGTALTLGNELEKTSKSQSKPAEKKKSQPAAKTTIIPIVKKKKGGILGTLGKVALWVLGIVVLGVVALYFIGDNIESSSKYDSNGQVKNENFFVEMPGKAIIKKEQIMAEGTVYPKDARLESNDGSVAMSFDPLCFDEPTRGKIIKVKVENPPENTVLNIYDFQMESLMELEGIATLEIRYDASKIPDGMTTSECVSGVYYDKELREWVEEAYKIDENKQVVLISATHLSEHGTKISLTRRQAEISDKFIRRIGKGAPYERTVPLKVEELMHKLSQKEMKKILNSLGTYGGGNPNKVLGDASLKALGDGGSFLGIGNEVLKLSPYSKAITKRISNGLTKFGGALFGAQLVSDIYFKKPNGVILFNTAKGLTFWQGAAVGASIGGPLGGAVATVVLSGMFLLDVSGIAPIQIPTYSKEVYHRTAIKAYELYYADNGYSDKQWIELTQYLIKDVSEERLKGDAFNKRYIQLLKESVKDYTELFFNEDEKVITKYMEVAFEEVQGYIGSYNRVYSTTDFRRNKRYVEEYVEEILEGKYNGYTTSLQDEIQGKYNETLLKEKIPKIMKMKSEQQYLKQLDYLRKSQLDLIQMFNTTFYLYFVDHSLGSNDISKYASYYVAPIIKDVKSLYEYRPEKWIVQLNSKGEGSLDMTLIAHYRSNQFTEFGLYKKSDYQGILNTTAKPVRRIKIGTISSNSHYMNISGDDAKIRIDGERYRNIEVQEGESAIQSFTAKSDYEKTCYIIWEIGKVGRYKKEGNTSKVTHEFKKTGEYQVSATLYDQNDTKLAMDVVTVELMETNTDAVDITEEDQSNNINDLALALTGSVELLFSDGTKGSYNLGNKRIFFNNEGIYEVDGFQFESNISINGNSISGNCKEPYYDRNQELVLLFDNLNSRKLIGFNFKEDSYDESRSDDQNWWVHKYRCKISAINIPFKMEKNKSLDGTKIIYEYRFKGNITPYIKSCEMENLSTGSNGTSGSKWGKYDPVWEIWIGVTFK